jgi:FdhD protein
VDNVTEILDVIRFSGDGSSNTRAMVAREFPVTIVLNNKELVTLLCSPTNLEHLVVGYLSSEGFLESKDDIKSILVDSKAGVVRMQTVKDAPFTQDDLHKRIITSGCGRGASFYSGADIVTKKVESQLQISSDQVLDLVRRFQQSSLIYIKTHGVHSAALCDQKRIIVFSEDIGRHNAIDKIFGKCLLEDIPTDDRMVMTSGRTSSEIMHKAAKRRIPIIVSISAPTDLGVSVAEELGITLIGSAKGKRMNVYTNGWRVK